jgi:hypothetical protein
LRHGQGRIKWFDDVNFVGIWENGRIKEGKIIWDTTGESFEGFYSLKTGRFEGKGILNLKRAKMDGFFKEGQMYGIGELK